MGPCQTLHEAKIIVQFVNRQMEDQRRPNSCTAQCLAITQKGLILQHCALNFLRLKWLLEYVVANERFLVVCKQCEKLGKEIGFVLN